MTSERPPFDPQRYLGLDDREFSEFQSRARARRWWQVLFWLVWAKRRQMTRTFIVVVVGVAAITTVWTAFLAIVEPWNHSLYLWPTLTGSWYGQFAAPDGRQIVRFAIDGDSENPPIEGTAVTCDARGTIRTFSITGWTRNWRGTRFRLTTGRVDEFDDEGVRLAEVDGEWDRDSMRVSAKLERFKQIGGASISSTADPPLAQPIIQFALQRGNARAFADACGRLRASR